MQAHNNLSTADFFFHLLRRERYRQATFDNKSPTKLMLKNHCRGQLNGPVE
jgi:hypothetical protein